MSSLSSFSGDLVAWLANGNQRYMGRIDQQVKLRGFRIELGGESCCLYTCFSLTHEQHDSLQGSMQICKPSRPPAAEVETVMAGVDGVVDVAAVLQDAGTPTAAVIGYVTPAAAAASDATMVACRVRLPHYMCPSAVVCLEVMPRLANGKVGFNASECSPLSTMPACNTHAD